MSAVVLPTSPALAPLLARGALRSPFKRPRPDAGFPGTRLVLPGVRPDPDRLAAYERVCGFATGAGSGTLPVTYPHVLGFPLAMRLMSAREFPLPLLGLVHTSIEIVRHTGLPPDGEYGLSVHVTGLAPHRRGTQATVVTELRDEGKDGALVWESSSTYLARHRTGTATPGGTSSSEAVSRSEETSHPETTPRSEEAPHPETTPRSEATSNEATSAPVPPPATAPLPSVAEWRLAGDVGRRYGAASGDRNPIHLHTLTARLFGFPRAIAHGMWTVARCLAEHGTPQAVRVRAEFKSPVLLPGTVVYGADDTGRFELRGGERLHLTGRVSAPRA